MNKFGIPDLYGDASMSEKVKWLLTAIAVILPLIVTEYLSFLAAQYYLYAILALSLGLIWGYTGILSFGQAAFFGLGAYVMAWSYKYTLIPGINPGYVALLAAPLVTGIIAALLGYFLFYSDVKDVYFVIITLALSVILEQLATSVTSIFGGFNGLFLPRMKLTIPGVLSIPLESDKVFYYLCLVALVGIYIYCRRLINSEFGEAMIAIRENELRTQSLGYNTPKFKTKVFGISGAIAGVAGALYATLAGFISPSLSGFVLSTEVVIWVAVGGRQYLLGAIVGGILVNGAATVLSSLMASRYILLLGAIFVAVVVTFREGIIGYVVERFDWEEKL